MVQFFSVSFEIEKFITRTATSGYNISTLETHDLTAKRLYLLNVLRESPLV